MRRNMLAMVSAVILAWLTASPLRAEPLPALGADLSRTTVSGLSSGAYMAGQFQVAYSQTIVGAALIAGGPYACAHSPGTEFNPVWPVVLALNVTRAQNSCMRDRRWFFFSSVPSASSLLQYAETLAAQSQIDPVAGLREDKVYLFSSSEDSTVKRGVVEGADAFYREAGVPDGNIRFEKRDDAAHAFLTETEGPSCGVSGPPFLNDCDYDQAEAILNWLVRPLQPAGDAAPDRFMRFEQTLYASDLDAASLGAHGIAYVPQNCEAQPGCAVHIVFHGCNQSLNAVGEAFVQGAGFARWAESNRLVLLFPQTAVSALNPEGCWDWWGYTGPDFLTRDAPQMLAVKRMLDRLADR